MKISEAKLQTSVFQPSQLPSDNLPKVVFWGRSNVGKSSMLNRLVGRKGLARISSRPGKTVSINYYRLNGQLLFVDFPGYGYARLPQGEQRRIEGLIDAFFRTADNLRLVVLLLDCRREVMTADAEIIRLLLEKKCPILTILTKSDKLSFFKLQSQLDQLHRRFGVKAIPFSIKSNASRDMVWHYLDEAIKE